MKSPETTRKASLPKDEDIVQSLLKNKELTELNDTFNDRGTRYGIPEIK